MKAEQSQSDYVGFTSAIRSILSQTQVKRLGKVFYDLQSGQFFIVWIFSQKGRGDGALGREARSYVSVGASMDLYDAFISHTARIASSRV